MLDVGLTGNRDMKYLCQVCASTYLASPGPDHNLYRSLAWVANWLRDAIRNQK
jgi:hypothetical protein